MDLQKGLVVSALRKFFIVILGPELVVVFVSGDFDAAGVVVIAY